jgi:hypothetical protein
MSIVYGIDYGPLGALIGTWKGEKGMDLAPEPDGLEENPYHETITFSAIGSVTNAESQTLAGLHYRQQVFRKKDGQAFHDQTGYWMWDASKATVFHSFTIPRGVCVLAGGASDGTEIKVSAKLGHEKWSIIEAPFMSQRASTKEFTQILTVKEGVLKYSQTTIVDIYGRYFEHTDTNELRLS